MGELCFVSSTLQEVSRLLSTGGELFFTDPYRVMLPASLSGAQKTKWECSGLNLPGGSPPLLPRDEAVVINLLLQELSDRLALKLDLCPNLDREVVQQVPGGRRFVIVGASHADRTWDTLIRRGGATVKKVIMPAWRAIRDKIPPMVAWMETAMADEPEDSLVIFQLLDSSMYLARTEEGGLAPAKCGADGIYHVEGESTLAPKEFQYGIFQMIKPILEAAGARPIILISPLPRFLLKGCCDSSSHIPNLSSPDYRRNLEDSIFDCRKNLKDFAFRLGLHNIRVLGPWNAVRRLGDNIWSADPVHPSQAAYNCIANSITEMYDNSLSGESAHSHPSSRPPRGQPHSTSRGRGGYQYGHGRPDHIMKHSHYDRRY